MSLFPAGSPAGRGVAGTIAATIGAAVTDWLGDHSEVLDMAAQAHAAAARARAQRDLELLEAEITAARQHLDELVPLEYSIEWLTCAFASGLDVVMVSLPGAA